MTLFQIEQRQISDIIIKNRARLSVGDVTDLANSISNSGLLNPIIITPDNYLIAGERRIAACQQIGMTTIDVRVADGISPDDKLMIELMENATRKEFTWSEELMLKYELHNYWKNKAEVSNSNWGYRDTSKRLHCSLGGLATDLALAEAIKVFPELKDQTTKARAKELYKSLGQQATAIQRMNNLSESEQENLTKLQNGLVDIPIKNTVSDNIINKQITIGNKVKELKESEVLEEKQSDPIKVIYVSENYKTFLNKIPDNTVGMIELDPPYAIEFNSTYGKANKIQSKAIDWTDKELYEFYYNYLPLLYKKLMDCSWILCWTGKKYYNTIMQIATEVGFTTQEPGCWIKPGGGSTNVPKKNMISNWEMFLLFRKGEAQFNTASLLSAISVNTVAPSQRIHQWEKPVELYDHFIKAMGKPGTIFLSPFAGSGNCLISAAKAKMMPIGCDKSNKYIPEFYNRLYNYLGISAEIEGI